MSAVNVIIGSDRVDVISDGAGTWPDGNKLLSVVVKCFAIPNLNCVVALRGKSGVMRWLLLFLPRFTSVDQMKRELPRRLKSAFGFQAWAFPKLYRVEVTIAGVEDGRPFAFTICSYRGFVLQNIDYSMIAPEVDGNEEILLKLHESTKNLMMTQKNWTSYITMAMMDILQLQRQKGGIGVFGQMTTVTKDGISTKIICRWPDKLMKPINVKETPRWVTQ